MLGMYYICSFNQTHPNKFHIKSDTLNKVLTVNNSVKAYPTFENKINLKHRISHMNHFSNLYLKNSSYNTLIEFNGTTENTIVDSVYRWIDNNPTYDIKFITVESELVNLYKLYKADKLPLIDSTVLIFIHGDYPIDEKCIDYLSKANEIFIHDPWNNEVLLDIMSNYQTIEIAQFITEKPVFRCTNKISSSSKSYEYIKNVIKTSTWLNQMLHTDFSNEQTIYTFNYPNSIDQRMPLSNIIKYNWILSKLLNSQSDWIINQLITQSDYLLAYNPIYVLLVQNHIFTTLSPTERDVIYRVAKAEIKHIFADNQFEQSYRNIITHEIKKRFERERLIELKNNPSLPMPYVKTISQAYLKLDQIIKTTTALGLNIIPQKLVGLHVCEAPGQFIFRLNKDHPNYEWLANTLPFDEGEDIIGDDYQIIKRNLSKWILCDVCELEGKLPKTFKPNLITSDLGLPSTKWRQEEVLLKPQTAVIKLVLTKLNVGGTCILKCFLPCKLDQTIKLMTDLYNAFEYLYFIKPSLNFDSAEFYIVGVNKLSKPKKENHKAVEGKLSQMTIMFYYYNLQLAFCNDNISLLKKYDIEQAIKIYNLKTHNII